MPIYTYECRVCKRKEDYLVQAGRVPDGCAGCGSQDIERVYAGQTVSARTSSKTSTTRHLVPSGPAIVEGIPCLAPGCNAVLPVRVNILMKEIFPTRDN